MLDKIFISYKGYKIAVDREFVVSHDQASPVSILKVFTNAVDQGGRTNYWKLSADGKYQEVVASIAARDDGTSDLVFTVKS